MSKKYADGKLAETLHGTPIKYDAAGRPWLNGGEEQAYLESVAFQIGKDEGLTRSEGLDRARSFIRTNTIKGRKVA